jgi:hypothetical protein
MGLSTELKVSESLEEFRVAVRATEDGRYAFQIFRVGGEPRTLLSDSPRYMTPADAAQAGYEAIAYAPVMPRSAQVPPAHALPRRGMSHVSPTRAERDTLTARALRYSAMSALVLIVVVALLCIALLALFGILWASLHFSAGEDDDD